MWNPNVHYRIHNSSAHVQIDPVHVPHPSSPRSILILSSHRHLGLPSGLLPSGFPTKSPVCTCPLPHTCYMPYLSRSFLYHKTWIFCIFEDCIKISKQTWWQHQRVYMNDGCKTDCICIRSLLLCGVQLFSWTVCVQVRRALVETGWHYLGVTLSDAEGYTELS